ncbi:hypothetical protein [Haloterrigena salinisoli]|uniref:DUF7344 domain-containing protein n=1 Tax=Haloterrigena salinisoli TaxID=3132747 RepID=UPI0030D12C54
MVTLGTVFELLTNERRRYALYYLYEQDGPVTISDLVETIDRWEDGSPPQESTLDTFDEIALDLKHHQLPKSAEVEFIQYEPERGTVQIQGSPEKFDTFVTIARLIEDPSE